MASFFVKPFVRRGYSISGSLFGGRRRRRSFGSRRRSFGRRRNKRGVFVTFSTGSGKLWGKRYRNYFKAGRAEQAMVKAGHSVVSKRSVFGRRGVSYALSNIKQKNIGTHNKFMVF